MAFAPSLHIPRISISRSPRLFPSLPIHYRPCCSVLPEWSGLRHEIEQARRERRPYRIDKCKLTQQEQHYLRLRSKAIPLVADSDPLDIVYEDDTFLAVSKPSFLKMHPHHRFLGGTLLNRAIGYLGYAPHILHRLDMVRIHSVLSATVFTNPPPCIPSFSPYPSFHTRPFFPPLSTEAHNWRRKSSLSFHFFIKFKYYLHHLYRTDVLLSHE